MAVRIPLVTTFSAKGIKSAIKEFKAFNNNLDRARFLSKRLLLPATVALGGATLALGKVLFEAAKAAADDEASQKLLEKQLLNTTKATSFSVDMAEAFIGKLETATGVADDQLRPSLARLAMATGDVTKAQELLTVALDVSAGSGKTLDEVTSVLIAAMSGNFKALKQLGIEYESTGNKAKDMENVQKLLAQAFGGQAAVAADTFQGKLKILGVAFGNLQEAVGQIMLPALTRFVTFLTNNVVPGLQVVVNALGAGGLRPALVAAVALFGDFGIGVLKVMRTVAVAIADLVEPLGKVAQVVALSLTPIIGFSRAWQLFNDIANVTQNAVQATKDKFDAFIASVAAARYQMDLFAAAGGNVNNNIMNAEKRLEGFGVKVKAVKPPVEETEVALNKLGGGINKVAERAEKAANALRDRMAAALNDAKNKVDEAQTAFDNFKAGVSGAISGVVNFGDAAQTSAERGGVTFFDALQEQADKAKEFGSLVDQLLAAGLSKEALQQVLDAGQEAGTFIAKELLKSSENILRANQLVEETTKIAQDIGQRGAEKFYQAGVVNAAAYLKGVEETVAKAEALLRAAGLTAADVKGIGANFDDVMARLAAPIAGATMGAGVIPSSTSVVVNTVTAPSNLGDVIVDALRDYNRRSGPLQLEIE